MLSLQCLVDNTAQRSSSYRGEHGVSFLIRTPDGAVLFDTGQSGDVLLHNAAALDVDFSAVQAVALSHAHYDHTGGLPAVIPHLRPGLPLYANPDLFRPRYSEDADGAARSIGLAMPREALTAAFELRLSPDPVAMIPGVWTTGVIANRPLFEGRSTRHFVYGDDGQRSPDPYADDLSLVLQTDEGLVIVCGCCHAGLLNTLAHVRDHFDGPIRAVIGGTHLAAASPADLTLTIEQLENRYDHPTLYLNHCSGERAIAALAGAFPDRVNPCPAGTQLAF
jgi:7,8-dihydropterin-6-yl-methyl-4-(beta-D-ribofuranosyl)aminobenzene 5'-phosphate synthase